MYARGGRTWPAPWWRGILKFPVDARRLLQSASPPPPSRAEQISPQSAMNWPAWRATSLQIDSDFAPGHLFRSHESCPKSLQLFGIIL